MNKFIKILLMFITSLIILALLYFVIVKVVVQETYGTNVASLLLISLVLILISFAKPKSVLDRERNAKQWWDR